MVQELMDRTGTKKVARKNKHAGQSRVVSDTVGDAMVNLTPFDYELDVDTPPNSTIINLAAKVVMTEARVRTSVFIRELLLMMVCTTRNPSLLYLQI